MEIKLIKTKDEYYLNYLKNNKLSYSYFFNYYSQKQKNKMLKLIQKQSHNYSNNLLSQEQIYTSI